eukprot:COSAG06_NODE_4529_length_4153_cov_1.937193_5_plen_127_part_00
MLSAAGPYDGTKIGLGSPSRGFAIIEELCPFLTFFSVSDAMCRMCQMWCRVILLDGRIPPFRAGRVAIAKNRSAAAGGRGGCSRLLERATLVHSSREQSSSARRRPLDEDKAQQFADDIVRRVADR